MVRPKRRATASDTCTPILVEPVKETSSTRGSLSSNSPTSRPEPIARLKIPDSPWSATTLLVMCVTAMAVRGV
jgi:hypothetical protein